MNPLVQIFHDLRFLRPLDVVLLRVLDIMLNHLAKLDKRFPGNQLGRKHVINRCQNLLLDLTQRNRVIRFFARQLFNWKVVWEIDDHEPRFARLLCD